eukprot:gene6768-3593_t
MPKAPAAGATAVTDRAGDGAERVRGTNMSRAELMGELVKQAAGLNAEGLQQVLLMITEDDTEVLDATKAQWNAVLEFRISTTVWTATEYHGIATATMS